MHLRLTLFLVPCLLASLHAHAQSPALAESRALNAEGLRLIAAGRLAEAEAVLQRALPLCASAAPFVANCISAVLSNLADIRNKQGDTAAALDLAQRSAVAAETTGAQDPLWLVFRYRSVAALQNNAGQHAEAEATMRRALAVAQGDTRVPPHITGECLLSLVGPLIGQGRMAEAVETGMRGIALLRPNVWASADRYADHMVSLANITIAQTALSRDADAEALLREAIRLPPPGGNLAEPTRLRLVVFLADALRRQGKSAPAEHLYREVAALWQTRPDPARLLSHLDAINGLAILLQESGREAQAAPLLRETHTLVQERLSPTDRARLGIEINLASLLKNTRRLDEAASLLETALAAQEAQAPRPTPSLAHMLFMLGEVRIAQLRLDAGAALLARATAAYETIGQGDSSTALDVIAAKADLAIIRGTEAEAPPLLRNALERATSARGSATTEYARRARAYATSLLATGDPAGAEAMLRRALAVHTNIAGTSPFSVHTGVELGRALDAQGRRAEAEALFDEAAANAAILGGGQAEARLAKAIGDHFVQTGRLDRAGPLYRRAMALVEADQGRESWAFVEAQDGQAVAALRMGDLDTAERAARDSLDLAMRMAGPRDMRRAWRHAALAGVLAEQSSLAEAEAEYLRAVAIASGGEAESTLAILLHQLGQLYVEAGRLADAKRHFDQALSIDRRISPVESERTASYLTAIASVLRREGDLQQAEALVEHALALRERLLPPTHVLVAESLNALGLVRTALGRPASAEAPLRRALAIRLERVGPRTKVTAQSRLNLATALLDLGRTAEAKVQAEEASAVLAAIFGPAHPQSQVAVSQAARMAATEGHPALAEDLLLKEATVLRAAYGANSRFVAGNLEERAALAIARGRIAEADHLVREALAIRSADPAARPDHPAMAHTHALLAHVRLMQGHMEEAEALQRRVLAIRQRQFGQGGVPVAAALNDLAATLLAQQRLSEAEALAGQAGAIVLREFGPVHARTLDAASLQARIAAAQGQWEQASADLADVLRGQRRLVGNRHPSIAGTLADLGWLAIARGHYAEAEAHLSEALSILVAIHGSGDVATTDASLALAALADARGNVAQAMAVRSRVLALREAASGTEVPALAPLLGALANDHARLGEVEPARAAIRRAGELIAQGDDGTEKVQAQLTNAEALIALREGRFEQAEQALLRLEQLNHRNPARQPGHGIAHLNNLALVQGGQGRLAQAKATLQRAITVGEAELGTDHPRLVPVLLNLADVAEREGRRTEADVLRVRAAAILAASGLAMGPAERWL
ncbi:MAG: tetratricopeptide repeat protein [Acetobacteraceae bacterium]|nr:tetratricopeptide repeat protein [Acetobacteraceae bacterium]